MAHHGRPLARAVRSAAERLHISTISIASRATTRMITRQSIPASQMVQYGPLHAHQRWVTTSAAHPGASQALSTTAEKADRNQQEEQQGPLALYTRRVSTGVLKHDAHQLETVKVLDRLYRTLTTIQEPPILDELAGLDADVLTNPEYTQRDQTSPDFDWHDTKENRTVFSRLWESAVSLTKTTSEKDEITRGRTTFKKIQGPQGLYLYGDVGSGKTMIMDLFYDTLPIKRKRRVHFHAFMQDVHRRQHILLAKRGMATDVIPAIANDLANDAWVLCFDEFQVVDITDAMILRRLIEELMDRGVVVVLTSNRKPDELYKNGIQRESFMNTIELLKRQNVVWQLDSGIDYRRVESIKLNVYFTPLNDETNKRVDKVFDKLTDGHMVIPCDLHFLGRTLHIEETTDEGVCKIDFADICGKPHSAADYLELTNKFHTIVLKYIPKMTLNEKDSARRFITLVDTIYDSRGRLVISAEVELEDLFIDDSITTPDGAPTGKHMKIDHSNHEHYKKSHPALQLDRSLIDDLHLEQPTSASEAPSIFTGTEEIFAFRRSLSRLNEMRNVRWLGEDFREKLLKPDY